MAVPFFVCILVALQYGHFILSACIILGLWTKYSNFVQSDMSLRGSVLQRPRQSLNDEETATSTYGLPVSGRRPHGVDGLAVTLCAIFI